MKNRPMSNLSMSEQTDILCYNYKSPLKSLYQYYYNARNDSR